MSGPQETQSPTLRGAEKTVDLSGAIPFLIDVSSKNTTTEPTTELSGKGKKPYTQFLGEEPENEDDDFYGGFFSGGTVMTPDYPTKEQQEAEKDVRAVLFKEFGKKEINYSKPDNQIIDMMLNSPMFQNKDGFTAMNDFGLSIQTNIDSRNPAAHFIPNDFPAGTEPAEHFGIAAANDEAETTVDDFFPAPFIPFTM